MRIFFEGQPVEAREGDSVASTLYRAGRRVFTRSFKYHRPRGLLCCAGRCPNCLMDVDGVPNVRTCVEPARDGMQVRHQNAVPSLETDVFSVIDGLDRFFPVGFYHKTFINRHYWHAAEPAIRRVAGLGVVPPALSGSGADQHGTGYEHGHLHAEVAVVGGGASGMAAALAAAEAGAAVTLIEEQPELGGQLRTDASVASESGDYAGLPGMEVATRLAAAVTVTRGITVLTGAFAFGCYEGLLLGVLQGKRLIHVRAGRLIVATGAFEYPSVFQNNDLPGVMLGSAAQRLIRQHQVQPGRRALVVTDGEFGRQVARDLQEIGAEVTVLEEGRALLAAAGRGRVEGAVTVEPGADGRPRPGSERTLPCDLICLSVHRAPANGLLYQSGCRLTYDDALGMAIPTELAPSVFAAGEVIGHSDLASCLASGEATGRNAAVPAQASATIRNPQSAIRNPGTPTPPHPHTPARRSFLCFCLDVTEKDVRNAVAEGFSEMELLKRYATFGMGPCQGKMCGPNNLAACARETDRTVAETGTTTARPPMQPVPLGALAGGSHHPIRRTPMHHRHLESGARMMDMGEWKRPLVYGGVESEYDAVRERVGLIDVSTLGKLDMKGRDAGKLLDRVYTHVFSTLRPGRTRYGVICDDAGIILDDGTVTRLAEDHYFITTTTGNIDFVEQWLEWWSAGTTLDVHVTNVTAGYASVNLAGPRARETLARLTDLDLSSGAFPYMGAAQGTVAGAPALLLRLGFVGETGWEIHVPAEYGATIWDALLEAGSEVGIAPFGVEAQRLLRLEKKHVIVGVDTDALANPLDAGMAWVIGWDKADFIGKRSLEIARRRGSRNRLVGFKVSGDGVPEDGGAIAEDGRIIGRVTSCRHSPHVGAAIGLAWLPAASAADGTAFEIRLNGRPVPATVTDRAFYDPEGLRLRS